MERATAVQARKALEMSSTFVKAGVRFIPMPVFDDIDEKVILKQMSERLDKAVNGSEPPAPLSEEER